MELKFEKESSDVRGKILFLAYGHKRINIVEIKKGFSRGGHYHDFESTHHIISGKIEYRQKNIQTGKEHTRTVDAPATIRVPPEEAHLLTALEDTVFAEEFGSEYEATEYPEYRDIVTRNMK